VRVFITAGGELPALAAKAATSTIPIVFILGSDPVKSGLVSSYSRPGGNVTGINMLTNTLETKRLGLLHDLVPHAPTVGVLINPKFLESARQLSDLSAAARSLGLKLYQLRASTDEEIGSAFDEISQNRIAALAVAAEPFFNSRREMIVSLAARHKVAAIYQFREYIHAGGLASYGIDLGDGYRQVASYAGQILKGAQPADLPVVQPTKFEFILNMKAAKELNLSVSTAMQLLADEIIE
jgi:putative ABC transport system substrate-binding protein